MHSSAERHARLTAALFSTLLLVVGCKSPGSGHPAQSGGSGGGAAGGGGGGLAGAGGGAAGSGGGGGAADAARGGSGGGSDGGDGADAAPPVDRAAVLALMRRVADYELVRFGTTTNNNWVRAVFHTGLQALYRATSDAKYLTPSQSWGQANAWGLGPDSNRDVRFADNEACVQTYAELYLRSTPPRDDTLIAPARTVFDGMVAAQPPLQGRVVWWWCDALFMAPPALARMAVATGKTAYFDLLHAMWWDTTAFLYDPVQHLFWRDDSFRNTSFWSRGNGWVVGGIARVLEVLPAADARRPDYENLMRQMADKLRAVQRGDGFWPSNLLDASAFPNPESSGTAFFTYGLAFGINQGILDRALYLDTVTRGWGALGTAVNAQGRLGWVQAVGAQPGPATVDSTNDYATGALLLAGSELLKL